MTNEERELFIEAVNKQLSLFWDTDEEDADEKRRQANAKKREAAKKAAATRKKKKEDAEKDLSRTFDKARGAKKDIFGNETSDEERAEAERHLQDLVAKKKKKKAKAEA